MAIAAIRNQLKTVDINSARDALDRRHGVSSNSGNLLISNQQKWILDADIKGFFQNINHE